MSKLLIVDANYMLNRAIFKADLDLFSKEGVRTGGFVRFLQNLNTAISSESYDSFILVFDYGKNARRLAVYPEYKLKVKKPIEELSEEDRIRKELFDITESQLRLFTELLGIVNIKIQGHEADDIIYFLSKHLASNGDKVYIASDDSDYIQMIQDNITIYRPMKGDFISIDNYIEFFPHNLNYFVFHKAMVGDGSDNIKGAKGIGPKTASKIIDYIEQHSPDNQIAGALAWAKSGNKAVHINLIKDFPLVKRNLRLVDISYMKDDASLYIDEYNKAKENLSSNFTEFTNYLHLLKVDEISTWLKYIYEH